MKPSTTHHAPNTATNGARSTAANSAATSPVVAATTPTFRFGVYNDASYPASSLTNYYLQQNQAAFTSQAVYSDMQSRLQAGQSLNLTITCKTNPTWPADFKAAGGSGSGGAADTWLSTYVTHCTAAAAHAASLNNGTYVLVSVIHEAQPQTATGGNLAGQSMADVGYMQQAFGAKLKAANSKALFAVWIVGYRSSSTDTREATQVDQITNPAPQVLTWDPYANSDGSQTLAGITSDDIDWWKQRACYTGQPLMLTETGMATNQGATEAQLAAFYTNVPGQIASISAAKVVTIIGAVFFNSNNGSYPHVITQAAHPSAFDAITASLSAPASSPTPVETPAGSGLFSLDGTDMVEDPAGSALLTVGTTGLAKDSPGSGLLI